VREQSWNRENESNDSTEQAAEEPAKHTDRDKEIGAMVTYFSSVGEWSLSCQASATHHHSTHYRLLTHYYPSHCHALTQTKLL